MTTELDGKTILVTGAGSGIGAATALKLLSLGATVGIADIDTEKLNEIVKRIYNTGYRNNVYMSSWPMDVRDPKDCGAFVHLFMDVDGLVNCAGVNPTATPLAEMTDEYYDLLMDTNVRGTFNMTRAAVREMSHGASIVNISSVLGLHPSANNAVYCASKHAVIGFSKSMALELGPKGIRVNVVAPGFIDTPTNISVRAGPEAMREQESKVALGRMGTAEEVADVVAFLFSDGARYMNGSVVEVNGGLG